jgi:hypothetical protein
MNRLKGPDLKMPDLRVPAFVSDLYYDLRERRLLPLVVLVLVAILAVPFLLSSGSEPKPAPVAPPEPTATASGASELTVVRATPGLRDYRRRLRDRTPTDPFKQHFTAPDLSGAKLGSPGDNGFETSSATSTSTTTSPNGTSTVTKETTKSPHSETTKTTTETETKTETGGQPSESQVTLYSFAIDVKITRTADQADGGKDTSEPEVRHGVVPPAPLPSAKTQVVTYLGISPKTHNPLLLVSEDVTAIFGEAKCLSGSEFCQLLEVEPGFPITFVFGETGTRYKVNVLKVEPVVSGHF